MSSVGLDEGVHWWCPLWAWMEEFIDDVLCGPGWRNSLMIPVTPDGRVHWWHVWAWMEEFIDDVSCGPGWRISLTIPVGLDRGIHWYCFLWAWMESSLMMSSVDLDEGVHWWCPLWTWMEEFIDDVSCGPGWRVSLTIPVGLDRGIHWYCLLWAWMEEFIDDISVGLDGVAHWWHLWVWMEQLIDHSCAPRWRSSLMIPLGLDGGAHWWCLCGSRRRSSLMMSSVDLHGGMVIPGSDVSHFSSSL